MRGIKDLTGQKFGELTVLRLGDKKKRRWKWVVQCSCGVEKSTPIIRNGIDRKNSLEGYVPSNCVPCCKFCNSAKGIMSYDEFLAFARKIVCHQAEKSTLNLLVRSATI
jgi:hypothetical protein